LAASARPEDGLAMPQIPAGYDGRLFGRLNLGVVISGLNVGCLPIGYLTGIGDATRDVGADIMLLTDDAPRHTQVCKPAFVF
jgi:hypothetical protein